MRQDLTDAIRRLARVPGPGLLAAAILALGLSTSTAVFTYVDAYTRPFPGAGARDLDQIWLATEDEPWGAVSVPDFRDLGELTGSALEVTGVGSSLFLATVRHEELTEVAVGEAVAGDFFSILSVDMAVGRGLADRDDRIGAEPVALVSYDYWLARYGGDPEVPGRTIVLNGELYTIVGVVGPEFVGTTSATRPQFWVPLEQYLRVYRPGPETHRDREPGAVVPIVRLAPGVSAARADAALESLARGLDEAAPLRDRTRRFVRAPATWISPETRDAEAATTRIMIGAAGFLLLLACANVANLVLSTGARRGGEMAIRGAMGASRGRLVRQLFVESLLLSVPAGLAALLLAGPLSARLSSYFARPSVWGANVPRDVSVAGEVVVFAFLTALVTGALAGIVPALRVSGRSPAAALGSRAAGGLGAVERRRRAFGTRDVLVTCQLAICVVLLFVAGLVLRTLESATSVDPGFDTRRTLASYVSTSSMGVPIPERHRFFEQLVRRFEELPWVDAATVAENAPLQGHPSGALLPQDGSELVSATWARVWPGYFETLSMELMLGRTFRETDTVDADGVVVVNEALALRLSADGRAVGRNVVRPGGQGEPDRSYEVVGVVRDARQVALLEDPGPVAYFSLPQEYSRPGNALLVRVRDDPEAAIEMMRRELHAVDTRLAIVNILSYRDVVRGVLYTQRMNAELFSVIAVLGLLLSAAGVFAVLGIAVGDRRREIGIRIAIGAARTSIVMSVLEPVGVSVVAGLGLGLVAAFVATRWVESLLWGVSAADPTALVVGLAALLATISLAVLVPLRRALTIDPASSLR